MRSIVLAAVCACSLASAAVASDTYIVTVSGFSDGAPVGGLKYMLAPEEQLAGQQRGLEMDEFGRHVERALSARGMVRVFSAPEADLLVTLGYGIGGKTQDETRSIPIMGQTGTVVATGVNPVTGKLMPVTKPVQGVVGYTSSSESVTYFARWMRLVAVDVATLRTQHVVREHWRLDVHSEGSSDDLRAIFPVMAFAASNYAGADTGKALVVKVKDKYPEYRDFLARPVSVPSAAPAAPLVAPAVPAPAH